MKTLLLLLLLFTTLFAKPTYNIAILSDGETEYSDQFEKSLKTEIKQILGRDYNVKFPRKLYRNGRWKYQTIAANVNNALQDDRSDMILTLGALSSHYIARKSYFPKPVVATAIINPQMQKIPYKNGVSGKHNLTYVSGYQTLDKDIETMQSLKPVKKVAILVDAVMLHNTPQIGRYISKKFAYKKINIVIIPITKNIQKSVEKIPDDVDFVYVTPLFQQTRAQKQELYSILTSQELASYSSIGADDVEIGALCANSPKTDNKRFIRQIALDVQQIALGAKASEQLVNFTPSPQLSLNMQTANEIGYTPSWELLSKATIVKSEQSDSHYFNVEEIMDRAVNHNLKVIASERQMDISEAKVEGAQSVYYPQVHFGAEAAKVDEDRAVASLGLTNETRVDAYVKFSQQIFNQELSAKVSVNKNFLKAQNRANDFVKLDIGLGASLNYLRILQLRTKLKIEKSNLELSKTNMRSAMTRRDIGIGNASDIYRWQTQIAGEKKSLLYTHTALLQAKHSLNNLLDLPQDLPLNFDPIDMNNPVFMTSNPVMKQYFLDQTKFAKFESYLIKVAKQNMPSIKQYDALEKARKLIVESNDNAFYMPTVDLEGGVKQHFVNASNKFRDSDPDRFSDFPYADNTDWEVGIFVRFPLYLGGAKTAQLHASKAALLIAEAQKRDLINSVEKNVRNSLYQAKASYLSIKLAQDATVSSRKNLELIKTVYAQGNIGIIDLLDAQNAALRSTLLENNTRYSFMADLLVLQHDIGQVNFNLNKNDWKTWLENLEKHNPDEDDDEE